MRYLFLILLFIVTLHAEYIEGIDTTDVNGWGLDTSFNISDFGINTTVGKIVVYSFESTSNWKYTHIPDMASG